MQPLRLRYGDLVSRYGGKEFSVVLSATSGAVAAEVLDEVRLPLTS